MTLIVRGRSEVVGLPFGVFPLPARGPGDNLGAILQMQFIQDVFHVELDGIFTDEESIRDFFRLYQTGG